MDELLSKLYEETGFKSYEPTLASNQQITLYGISSNVEALKSIVSEFGGLETGTIAYMMDTQESLMYYRPTDTWY